MQNNPAWQNALAVLRDSAEKWNKHGMNHTAQTVRDAVAVLSTPPHQNVEVKADPAGWRFVEAHVEEDHNCIVTYRHEDGRVVEALGATIHEALDGALAQIGFGVGAVPYAPRRGNLPNPYGNPDGPYGSEGEELAGCDVCGIAKPLSKITHGEHNTYCSDCVAEDQAAAPSEYERAIEDAALILQGAMHEDSSLLKDLLGKLRNLKPKSHP